MTGVIRTARTSSRLLAATCLSAGLLLALASPAGAAAPGTPEAPTAVAGVNSVTVTFNTDLTTSPAVTTYTIIADRKSVV